jgi:hypothetical protein
MEVFQAVYKYVKDQMAGDLVEHIAILIASQTYLVHEGYRPGAIVVLNALNNDLYSDLHKLFQSHNLLFLPYINLPRAYMILPKKMSMLREYEHLQQIPITDRNAIDIQTGRMLGYVSPLPLRTIRNIGKKSGEIRIYYDTNADAVQLAPQVVPEGIDIQHFLQPLADALNAFYAEGGFPFHADVVVHPFPLKGGNRNRTHRNRNYTHRRNHRRSIQVYRQTYRRRT